MQWVWSGSTTQMAKNVFRRCSVLIVGASSHNILGCALQLVHHLCEGVLVAESEHAKLSSFCYPLITAAYDTKCAAITISCMFHFRLSCMLVTAPVK